MGYAYDGFGRMVTASDSALAKSIGYTYDSRGLRTGLALGGTQVAYTYDDAMRLRTVRKDADAPAVYSYDTGGRRTGLALPNGVSTSYGYDTSDRLLDLTTTGPGGVLASFTYDLDPTGNRTGITYADGSRSSYSFDDAYRLTGEARTKAGGGAAYEVGFAYDAVGNRIRMTGRNVAPYRTPPHAAGLSHTRRRIPPHAPPPPADAVRVTLGRPSSYGTADPGTSVALCQSCGRVGS